MPRDPSQPPNLHVLQNVPDPLVDEFEPTQVQAMLRDVAEAMVTDPEEPNLSPDAWFRRLATDHKKFVTMTMFNRWQTMPRFNEWFMEVMPRPMSPIERMVSDAAIERALAAKAESGAAPAAAQLKAWRGKKAAGDADETTRTRDAIIAELRGGKK